MSEMDLSKQVGPLPLGAWVAVVGGGLALGYFINKRANAANNAGQQLTESGVGAGGNTGFASVDPPAPTPGEDDTNQKWGVRVTNWMVANGYDPATADNAVRKYLTGQQLTGQEQAIINIALTRFGVPPESLPGPVPTAPPAVSGLVGVANGPHMATITWLPVVGATGYRVTGAGTGRFGATSYTWEVDTPPFIHTSLTDDYVNDWTVHAVNDYGVGPPTTVRVVQPRDLGAANTPSAPAAPAAPAPAAPAAPAQRTHTVASGDTLSGISLRYYGTASRWREIYNRNAGLIEQTARARGKSNSSGGPRGEVGWWIFPGTVLVIP